jgi:glycosyltransferase involved in cell wall biosynthesis
MLGVDQSDSRLAGRGDDLVNVLYICADWGIPIKGFKGASVHVREFVNALSRAGHQVLLVCAKGGEGNPDPQATIVELAPLPSAEKRKREAARLGVAFDSSDVAVCRELDKLSYDSEFAARALAQVREAGFRPDVLYERYSLFHASGARLARTLEVPYVVEVNAPLIEEQERHRLLRLKALATERQSRCFRDADHLITVSEALKEYIQSEGIPAHRVSCLANGVDTRRFDPHTDPAPIRARYALGTRPVIGFVGSLKPWHGMDFLLDAMDLLRKRQLDHRLLIVGDGPGLEHTRERVRTDALAEHVLLAGKVPHEEIPAYLAAMDLTVAPYTAEQGFYFSPLKVLESLAAGRPVVAPRLGQLNELIDHGVTGLLYEPGDLDAFVGSMHSLLSDSNRRAVMGAHARRHAVMNLSWDSVVGRAVKIMAQPPRAA